MDKSAFIGAAFFGTLTIYLLDALICKIRNRFFLYDDEEEEFWESHHQFQDSLEEANDLCDIGYTFQRNEVVYKKISGKKWFAEILIPDDQFEIGCELKIEDYLFKKIDDKAWTIENLN